MLSYYCQIGEMFCTDQDVIIAHVGIHVWQSNEQVKMDVDLSRHDTYEI